MKIGTLVKWNQPIPDLREAKGYRVEWKTGVIVDLKKWGDNFLLKIHSEERIITRVSDKVEVING